jgi:hypothetical protein
VQRNLLKRKNSDRSLCCIIAKPPIYGLFYLLIERGKNKMCFSPQASFAGGAIISAIRVITLNKVHKPSLIVFGTIPLYFGIQRIV